jgi:hypothetical protein
MEGVRPAVFCLRTEATSVRRESAPFRRCRNSLNEGLEERVDEWGEWVPSRRYDQ